jgi:hypothetical protein
MNCCVDWCLPWKRVFASVCCFKVVRPLTVHRGRGSFWYLLLVRIDPGHGHRRTSDLTVKYGGCMPHILVCCTTVD